MQRESISTKTFAKGIAAGVIALSSLGILQVAEYSVNMRSYVPGTYTASAQGMDGPVYVQITVDKSSITDVSVDVSGETPGIGAEIADEVRSQILASQSAEIDGVAGATVSSDAVRAALDDAMTKAENGEADTQEEAPAENSAETEAKAENSDADIAAEAATEAAVTEAVTEAAQDAAAGGAYVPGTYTGTGAGIDGDVSVTITVDEASITEVKADVSGETPGLGAEIGPQMEEAFMAAQGADVDSIAGCTVTSTGLKDAMADALSQAEGGSAAAAPADEEVTAEEAVTEAAQEAVTEAAPEAVTEAMQDAAAGGAYVPGTYTGTGAGIDGDVTVTVTVDETSITEVKADVSGETPGLGAEIGPQMEEAFMAAQSADVDSIAGCTVTSTGLKDAMADALSQAEGGAAAAAPAAAEEAVEEAVTEAAEETVTEAVEEVVTEAAEEAVTEASEEAVTEAAEEAVTEAAQEAAEGGAYVPGTYTGTGAGIDGDVTVTITVDESSITDVKADVSGETPGLGAEIGPQMEEAFMAAQSAEVDSIAGCTVTSTGLKDAMNDALAQAAAGEAAEAAEEAVTEAAEEAVTEGAEEAEADGTASAVAYKPGTYSAAAAGLDGAVTVTVTVDETSITDVVVDVSGETPGVGAEIGDQMVDAFMKAQSADVDVVAGSTVTSEGLKQAMKAALEAAAVK